HGFAGIVDDDDLLLDRFAGKKVVVLAREVSGLTADIGQERPVVAEQRLRRRGRQPVRPLTVRAQLPFPPPGVVRAEPRPLQVLPVYLEFLAPPVRSVARLPEGRVFPRGVRGDPPGSVGAPVVRDVPGEDLLPVVEVARPHGARVIPAVPEVAGPE